MKKQFCARRWLVAIACVLVGTGVWAADQTFERLESWRLAVVTNGFAATRAKVETADRKRIYQMFRDKIGIECAQLGVPHWVGTNEYGRIADLPARNSCGGRCHFGVKVGGGNCEAWYWSVEGLPAKENPTISERTDFILQLLFPHGKKFAKFQAAEHLLDARDSKLFQLFSGIEIPVPFDRYWFYFCDDCPAAEWTHPVRYVFVNEDLSAYAVYYSDQPASLEETGTRIGLQVVGSESHYDDVRTRVKMTLAQSSDGKGADGGSFRVVEGGDPSRCFALLFCGGIDKESNHCRYWKECCYVYNVLRKCYGIPRENIKVLWAGGNPSTDLCSCEECRKGFPTTGLSDFDADGKTDISGAASGENLVGAMNWYAANLKKDDQLLVYVTDHGGNYDNEDGACVWLWNNKAIKDVDFAAITQDIPCPTVFALKTCYGGGMMGEICASAKNRFVATSDAFDSSMGSIWTYNFFGALSGNWPSGLALDWVEDMKQNGLTEANFEKALDEICGVGIDPRGVGLACDADANLDGKVSFQEAAAYAQAHNPFWAFIPEMTKIGMIDDPKTLASKETPNIGKQLFMTQYADAPAVVVQERVATPRFVTSSGAFAPYLVEVRCDTVGATIRYTLDGSEPRTDSAVYRNGIEITRDCTVKVKAFKSDMDPSATASAEYAVRKTAPEKAMIVSVSQADSTTGIVIEWLTGDGTASVDILRSESVSMASSSVIATSIGAEQMSYADMTALPGRTYYYQVRACNAYGKTLSAVSQKAELALQPPSGVSAAASSVKVSSATITVSWKASSGATHYKVFRKSAGGGMVALGGWQTALSASESVSFNGGATFSYYVKAASDASGKCESPYSAAAEITVTPSLAGSSLVLSDSSSDWSIKDTSDLIVMKPGAKLTRYCWLKYADGTYEKKNFTTGVSWSADAGFTVTPKDGTYSYTTFPFEVERYTPPSADVMAGAASPTIKKIVVSYTSGGETIRREVSVLVSNADIIESLELGKSAFAEPGETLQLTARCKYFGASSFVVLPEDVRIEWSIISGSGATLTEDGELTIWPVTAKSSVTVQAKVNTVLGPVIQTMAVSFSPMTITRQTAVIPPLGGASTNLVGWMGNSSTYCSVGMESWISGLCYLGSKTTNPNDATISFSLLRGQNKVSINGWYMFICLKAGRNPGKDRDTLFKLRWEGGGIDFTVVQQEAPYADEANVRNGSNGGLSVATSLDGSFVHYATDGEEPSEDSPLAPAELLFKRSKAVAFKSYGDWMQPSDTVYTEAIGTDDKVDEVQIDFDPVESGVRAPTARVYKVNEMFGELPVLSKSGLYFKGWSLAAGSTKKVRVGDYVPSASTTLYAIWSKIAADEPEWTALPWNFKSSMTGTFIVKVAGTEMILDPTVCTIGVEDLDSICRGSTGNGFGDMPAPGNGVNGRHVFGVYGNVLAGSESGLEIRVWHPEIGFLNVLNSELTFTANGMLGTSDEPYVVQVELVAENPAFALTFDWNDGSGKSETRPATQSKPVGVLPVPERKGWVFAGWWTSRDGGSRVTPETTMVAYDVRLYAHWGKIDPGAWPETAYEIEPDTTVRSGNLALVRAFDGEALLDEGVFYAKATLQRGRVYTFAKPHGDGTTLAVTGAGLPEAWYATAGGLDYVLVDLSGLEGDGEVDYYAVFGGAVGARSTLQWVEGNYVPTWAQWTSLPSDAAFLLEFDANDGRGVIETRNAVHGKAVGALPVPVRSGYVFAGWWTSRDGGSRVTPETKMVTYDVRLYAHWGKIETGAWSGKAYEITPDATVSSGSPTLVRAFDGEALLDEGVFYAKATLRRGCRYTFAKPHGDGTTLSVRGSGLPEAWYATAGNLDYVLVDLSDLGESCTVDYYAVFSGAVGARSTLQWVEGNYVPASAHWTVLPDDAAFELTFDWNDGSGMAETRFAVHGRPVGELPVPERDGWAFAGWWTSASGGGRVTESTVMVTYDVRLYARWEPVPTGAWTGSAYLLTPDATIRSGVPTLVRTFDDTGFLDEGVFVVRATLTRGRMYTFAKPHGDGTTLVATGAASGLPEVRYATSGGLDFIGVDLTGLGGSGTVDYFVVFSGAVGARSTLQWVEGDYMP